MQGVHNTWDGQNSYSQSNLKEVEPSRGISLKLIQHPVSAILKKYPPKKRINTTKSLWGKFPYFPRFSLSSSMKRKVMLLSSPHRTNQGTEKVTRCPGSHSKKGSQNSKAGSLAPESTTPVPCTCVLQSTFNHVGFLFPLTPLLIAPGDIKIV